MAATLATVHKEQFCCPASGELAGMDRNAERLVSPGLSTNPSPGLESHTLVMWEMKSCVLRRGPLPGRTTSLYRNNMCRQLTLAAGP